MIVIYLDYQNLKVGDMNWYIKKTSPIDSSKPYKYDITISTNKRLYNIYLGTSRWKFEYTKMKQAKILKLGKICIVWRILND